MNITLQYRKGKERISTRKTNNDIEIIPSERDGELSVRLKAWAEIKVEKLVIEAVTAVSPEDRFLLNGYQSWTDTREFTLADIENNIYRLPKFLVDKFSFDRYGDACFYHYSKEKLHGYDVFYSRGTHDSFFLSLNADNAYLIFEVDRKSGNVDAIADIAGLEMRPDDEIQAIQCFTAPSFEIGKQLLRKYYPNRHPEKIFGYTSWYNYYQNINEKLLLKDLSALDNRFQLFQIDDGYETFVGDWTHVNSKKFPKGLSKIVGEVHGKGMKAGIWLAPFVAEEKSKLFRKHPNWFCRDGKGHATRCGCNWSGFYALDFYQTEVREYIAESLRFFMNQGFDFFKFDFLYAVCCQCPSGKTRAMVASEAFSFLREILGNRLILGCGAPVFSAIGTFDYLRIGPDVSLAFDDVWFMRKMHRERISTKVTLQNTVYRSFFNGYLFGNDPDVFILRDDNVKLTAGQKKSLIMLNALFGSVMMTSDNLDSYDGEKKELLNQALELFRHGEVVSYVPEGDTIQITYQLNGKTRQLSYEVQKGELQ